MNIRIFSFFVLSLFGFTNLFAQSDTKIPVANDIKIGKLPNGLTYYVKQNPKPADKVELRLVINTGSILEDSSQLGLAHFTEHMCFNGTKNFQKNELVDYLQSIGVKFGAHLNAYTSFDETVYILPIPSDNDTTLESGMQILEDWAHNVLFTDEEIDKERGVVLEEYRLGLGPDKRMMQNYLPKVMYNSQYAKRLPIGTKEVLENFEYETIRRYYRDWYRPDLMAVIAVGDVSPEKMEALIVKHFSGLVNPPELKERIMFDMPAHQETLVAIETDKEAAFSRVSMYYKNPQRAEPVITEVQYKEFLIQRLFSSMLNNRLDEIRNSANPPFVYGGSYYGGTWARGFEAYQSYAMVAENEHLRGLEVLIQENERVKRFGFAMSELERAKKDIMVGMKRSFQEKGKNESSRLVGELVRNFLEQEPIPGIEWEYEYYKKYLDQVSIESINQKINEWITAENRVIVLTGPEKEGVTMPTEEEVLMLMERVTSPKNVLQPYEDKMADAKLMEEEPKAGKLKSTHELTSIGAKEWTFGNGAKVIVKKTDFKNDEIIMRAISKGGTSLFTDEEYIKTVFAKQILSSNGIGGFTNVELDKLMAGKIAGVSPYIGELSEGVSGSCSPENLKDMMQMLHLTFTSPNTDIEAYQSFMARQKGTYKNLQSNPNYYYQIEYSKFMQNYHPRALGLPTDTDWEQTDYPLLIEKYKERFANAGDFTFVFVGNVDEDKLLAFCKQYIASLPGSKAKENFKDLNYSSPKPQRKDFLKGNDPKSMVRISYTGKSEYDKKDAYYLKCLGEILSIKLVEKLREEKGGVYGVGAYGSMAEFPVGKYSLTIAFPCGPDRVDDLIAAAKAELQKIVDEGPSAKDLDKIKAAQRRDFQENLKKNRFWLNNIINAYYYNRDVSKMLETEKTIDALSVADIQKVAKKYCSQQPVIGVLLPETE